MSITKSGNTSSMHRDKRTMTVLFRCMYLKMLFYLKKWLHPKKEDQEGAQRLLAIK